MSTSALVRFNRAACWHRQVRVGPDRLRATSLDRLIYLWRWRWLGRRSAEAKFLQSRLEPGMHVIDAGANLGAYSHFFAHCVGPNGRVTSFEPDRLLFEALTSNAQANGLRQIKAHCVALGASSGHAQLKSGGLNSGDNQLVHASASSGLGFEIPVTTLDEFLQGESVEFIKMDVQGWEVQALQGMTQTLAANPRLQLYLELWPHGLVRTGSSAGELLAFLRAQGFEVQIGLGEYEEASLNFVALSRRYYWFTDVYAWKP
jgi:FkbM family methyltransferase